MTTRVDGPLDSFITAGFSPVFDVLPPVDIDFDKKEYIFVEEINGFDLDTEDNVFVRDDSFFVSNQKINLFKDKHIFYTPACGFIVCKDQLFPVVFANKDGFDGLKETPPGDISINNKSGIKIENKLIINSLKPIFNVDINIFKDNLFIDKKKVVIK